MGRGNNAELANDSESNIAISHLYGGYFIVS